MFVRDEDNHLQSEDAAMASALSSVNVIAQSMWGLRVVQYGDAHAYALQEYQDDGQGVYGTGQVWFTLERSNLKSYIFKMFHEEASGREGSL